MANFDTRKYHFEQKTAKNQNLIASIAYLSEKFFRLTNESNYGTFFAFCHLAFMKASPIGLSDDNLDSEYSDAYEYLKKLRQNRQTFLEELKEFLTTSSTKELVTSFSTFYQGVMSKSHKTQLGAYYTPISYCTDALAHLSTKFKARTIFDPFCGGGAWLCAFLLSRHPNLFEIESLPIYGTDIDRNAVILTRLNLSLLLPNLSSVFTSLQKQIRVVNSLYPNAEEAKILNSFASRCELVATNPPYGLPVEKQNKYFHTTLRKIPDKEVFYYAIERVREILPRQKPALYLVPNTFLFNLGSKEFKHFLSMQFDVSVWDHTNSDIFQTASVRTALLLLKEPSASTTNVTYSECFSKKPTRLKHCDFVDGKFKKQSKESPSGESTLLLDHIFEVSQGLIPYDKYRGHTADQISKRVYHSDKKLGSDYKRELQGKDVSSFSVSWSMKNWIKYGDWLAAPRDKKFFISPRVLIREITNSKTGQINCAFSDEEFYNTPSIINVLSREKGSNSERQLKTLGVLLSSSFYARFHLENSPKAKKGLFPKILVNDVRNLPLPKNFDSLDLSSVYNKASQLVKNGRDPKDILSFVDQNVDPLFSKRKAA